MKLICYRTSKSLPVIRPAPADRPWMDATPHRHAYRCLPLSMANACGWEIINQTSFSAIWDGGMELDSIKIRCSHKEVPAMSHFGSGILTFPVEGLFTTEPKVQLWAGGSPNRVKDGIQPLTGIMETEWSPYTFTMNWRFTRAHQRVRFEKDEPFCFIMPVSLELQESMEPEIRSLGDNPQLEEKYHSWRNSREKFNEELSDPDSDAVAKGWQKNYHRGQQPDGSSPENLHRTKVRLKKFANKTEGSSA